jgi:signal peptidase I
MLGAAGFAVVAIAGLAWATAGHGQRSLGLDPSGSAGRPPASPSPSPTHYVPFGSGLIHFMGNSMEPTIHDGQYVTVDTKAFSAAEPAHGDLIVYHRDPDMYLVQRIIAAPGDRVRIADGVITLNGAKLAEPYIAPGWSWKTTWQGGDTVTVPPDEFVVLGDNRDHVTDTRSIGYIARSAIDGLVKVRP